MDRYRQMRTITSIRARIKLAVFYLMDIASLFGTFFLGDYLQTKVFEFSFPIYVLFQVTNLLVCLYLCLPSLNNPNRNNFSILLLYVTRDKRKYLSNDFKFILKKGEQVTHG